jgi:hypothetical protein
VLGKITGVQECAPERAADCYKRRITKHARPKECPLPQAAMPRVRARLMAALETIRNALQHPPLSLHAKRRGQSPPLGTRWPLGICRGRTKNPTNPRPPHVYTTTPAHFIRNKREAPPQNGREGGARRRHTKTGIWGHWPPLATADWKHLWTSGLV